MSAILIRHYHSPVGQLVLGSYGDRLCLCGWAHQAERSIARLKAALKATAQEADSPVTGQAAAQLDEYFALQRREFSIPLLFCGTDFQNRVRQELVNIPYGTTISYAELARRVNCPKAYRAVGSANKRNMLVIFVPCHRVIGIKGHAGGYSGGVAVKQALLAAERDMAFQLNI